MVHFLRAVWAFAVPPQHKSTFRPPAKLGDRCPPPTALLPPPARPFRGEPIKSPLERNSNFMFIFWKQTKTKNRNYALYERISHIIYMDGTHMNFWWVKGFLKKCCSHSKTPIFCLRKFLANLEGDGVVQRARKFQFLWDLRPQINRRRQQKLRKLRKNIKNYAFHYESYFLMNYKDYA